jgi:hypothetical protein
VREGGKLGVILCQVSDWDAAVKVGVVLMKVHDKFPQLMSSLGAAVLKLLHKTDTDDLSFPDMALSTRSEFFRSHLYAAYTNEMHLKKYSKLLQLSVAGTLPTVEDIHELLGSCQCEVRKASLGFLRVYGCMHSDDTKAKFLLEDVSRFAHLEVWCPSDKLHFLKIFANPETVWSTVNVDAVVKGAYFLCSDY